MWKTATEKFSAKIQTDLHRYFQEDLNPLIKQAIALDEQEVISSEQLSEFGSIA